MQNDTQQTQKEEKSPFVETSQEESSTTPLVVNQLRVREDSKSTKLEPSDSSSEKPKMMIPEYYDESKDEKQSKHNNLINNYLPPFTSGSSTGKNDNNEPVIHVEVPNPTHFTPLIGKENNTTRYKKSKNWIQRFSYMIHVTAFMIFIAIWGIGSTTQLVFDILALKEANESRKFSVEGRLYAILGIAFNSLIFLNFPITIVYSLYFTTILHSHFYFYRTTKCEFWKQFIPSVNILALQFFVGSLASLSIKILYYFLIELTLYFNIYLFTYSVLMIICSIILLIVLMIGVFRKGWIRTNFPLPLPVRSQWASFWLGWDNPITKEFIKEYGLGFDDDDDDLVHL